MFHISKFKLFYNSLFMIYLVGLTGCVEEREIGDVETKFRGSCGGIEWRVGIILDQQEPRSLTSLNNGNNIPPFPVVMSEVADGFSYESSNSLFTNLSITFPSGLDSDEKYSVSVNNNIVGEFFSGELVDLQNFPGGGVVAFSILNFDPLNNDGSPRMINDATYIPPECPPRPVPEPTSILSLLSLGILGAGVTLKRKVKRTHSTEKEPANVG